MRAAVLVADAIAWYEDGERQEADGRGAEVELPDDEFDRLEAAGAVADPDSPEAQAAKEYDPRAGARIVSGTWGL